MPTGHWAYDAVAQLVKDGLIKGYPDGLFKGSRPMTRYEAAVLAYRAVDQIEAQITAGKAVTQADIDAANKLLAAFGNELKAVEAHVDKLQKQADATSALAAATAATVRKQQFHISLWERAFAYDQSIQANNGPLPVTATATGTVVGPGQAIPGYSGGAPSGSAIVGPSYPGVPGSGNAGGLSWGNQPFSPMPGNSNVIGNQDHGLGMSYVNIQFGGNPDDHTQYLVKLNNTFRYSGTNYYPSVTPAYCTNAGSVTGSTCTGANAALGGADGVVSSLTRLQELWYQYTSSGGIYVKVGKFQMDEGPKQITGTSWNLTDILDGGRIGFRNGVFNAYVAYGFDDTAAQQLTLYNIPYSQQLIAGEADVLLDKGRTDLGVAYQTYTGFHQILWDPYAILCQGVSAPTTVTVATTAGGTTKITTNAGNLGTGKILPYTHNQTYVAGGCGAGFAPISFGANAGGFAGPNAGLPITGAYVATQGGVQVPNISSIGFFAVENYGKIRLVVDGLAKLGNNPYTGSSYTDNLSGFFQFDYGPFIPLPGSKGKTTFELGGFASGFNGLTPAAGYYGGPAYWSTITTDPSGYYFAWAGVKKYLSDSSSIGVFYGHLGLLPNEIIPAGGLNCPGCAITGDSRNTVFGELFLGF